MTCILEVQVQFKLYACNSSHIHKICDYEIEQQVHLVEKNPLDTFCQVLITRMCFCVCMCVCLCVYVFFNRKGVFHLQDL